MPRLARNAQPGVIYHVITRGCGQRAIFHDEFDRRFFLAKMSSIFVDERVELLAFCLMDNHVHLVMKTEHGSMSTAMQRLLTSYGVFFNSTRENVGHVFQNRFFSKPCTHDSYLLRLVRYIHLNPVKARMVSDPADWPWSSHRDYLKPAAARLTSPLPVLQIFGGLPAEFAEFVASIDPKDLPEPGETLPDHEPATNRPSLVQLFEQSGLVEQDARSRRREVVARKRAFAIAATAQDYSIVEIARFLGLAHSSVCGLVTGALSTK